MKIKLIFHPDKLPQALDMVAEGAFQEYPDIDVIWEE